MTVPIPLGINNLKSMTLEELETTKAWLEPLTGLLGYAHGVPPNDPILLQWKQDLIDIDTEILERTLLK